MKIRPQDKRPDVALPWKVRATNKARLEAHADDINSTPEYTLDQILTEYFEVNKVKEREVKKHAAAETA